MIEFFADFDTESEVDAVQLIADELRKAKIKHPRWPDDPIHAAGVLVEEAGELMQACLDFCYDDGTIDRMKEEAAQVGAMAVRFLENIETYRRVRRNEA